MIYHECRLSRSAACNIRPTDDDDDYWSGRLGAAIFLVASLSSRCVCGFAKLRSIFIRYSGNRSANGVVRIQDSLSKVLLLVSRFATHDALQEVIVCFNSQPVNQTDQ